MDEGKEESRTRWLRMEKIYHAALSLSATERPAFVAQNCAGDAALQNEVASLLAADDVMADFLQEPVAELGLAVLIDKRLPDTEPISEPTQNESADLIGTEIADRYEVIKKLGGGGFGDVYKAADTKIMSRPVVIKVLKHAVLREEQGRRDWVVTKFHQEIEALSKIHDAGVVRIFDADTLSDGRPYIVMEFVEGPDLRHFIKQSRQEQVMEQGLEFKDVAEIVKQLGRTLTAAHDAEIFHRDLKPENIMLRRNTSGDLQVKIIDFGIAKVRNSLIAPSTATDYFLAGTLQYMAPEQLRGKKVSAACDIYALGVIAYELVTGRCPFAARDLAQLKDLQEAGVKVKPCDLNPDLPTAAQESILKALSFYPAERHNCARDFGDELARALADNEELARSARPEHPSLEESTLIKPDEIVRAKREEQIRIQLQPAPASRSGPRLQRRWLFAIFAVLLAGLIGFSVWRTFGVAVQQTLQQQQAVTTPDTAPKRTLTYWLSMQRPRDTKPFDSIGERIFDARSRLWFKVQTMQAGALYLFAEGNDKNGPSELNTLFPTKGNPWLEADKNDTVNEAPFLFRSNSGVIYLWIIWASRPVDSLDEIVRKSYETGRTVRDPGQQKELRDFIKQYKEPKPEVIIDELRFRVTLEGRSEILVDVRKLEYQP